MRLYALHKNILDIPNARSSHSTATPRGGGLAIVLCCLVGQLLLASFGKLDLSVLFAFVGAALLVALVGFIDDHGHIAPSWRLLVHFAAALWVLFWLGSLPPVPLFSTELSLGWLGNIAAVIGLVWLLNLFNFMDGIDGIAASEAIFVAGAGLLFASLAPHSELQWVAILIIGSTLGFLIWNWPPAKIFMGDVGSGFLGMVLGIYAWWSVGEGVTAIWTWLIIFGVFLVDATITLIRRFLQRLTWYEAHRSHAYQHAAARWGHRRVTIAVAVINVGWLLPIAYFSTVHANYGPVFALMALSPLVVLVFMLGAGMEKVVR